MTVAMVGAGGQAQADVQVLGGANFYEHGNHSGFTIPVSGSGGTCINLASNWHNRISSIKYLTQRVHLYSLPNCWVEGGYPDQAYTSDTTYVGDAMNDRAKSFRIW